MPELPKTIALKHEELHTILDGWTKDELIRQIIRMYDKSVEMVDRVNDLRKTLVEKGILPQ